MPSQRTGKWCMINNKDTHTHIQSGPPPASLHSCASGALNDEHLHGWRPCPALTLSHTHLRLEFERAVMPVAVIVHVSHDGYAQLGAPPTTIDIRLLDEANVTHYVTGL
jgi:hypothetical protein